MLKFCYRAKWLKKKERIGPGPVYGALLSVALCMVCLAGTTWAWFTGSRTVTVAPIEAASWSLRSVKVYQLPAQANGTGQTAPTEITAAQTEDGVTFEAAANTRYQVTASAGGTSSVGFIRVETVDGDYYTTARDAAFELCLSCDGPVNIRAVWGADYRDASRMPENMALGGGAEPAAETMPSETAEPEAMEPEVTEAETTPAETTPAETTQPQETEPETTEPETTEPEATEPEATEPEATEPEATEPEVTEPEITDTPAAQETTGEAAA